MVLGLLDFCCVVAEYSVLVVLGKKEGLGVTFVVFYCGGCRVVDYGSGMCDVWV
jgi:hypothetical protein